MVASGLQSGQVGVVVAVDPDGDIFVKLQDGSRGVYSATNLRLPPSSEAEVLPTMAAAPAAPAPAPAPSAVAPSEASGASQPPS